MSRVLEKSLGGILNSLIGSGSSLGAQPFESFTSKQDLIFVSQGLINFVERLEAARKISKQEEEDIVREEYQEWLRHVSHQNTKNEIIADYLCRSLIAFSRAHYFTNFHINAIKLTQSDKLLQKKIGYLYISRTMAPGSDLTVLLVNTIQRDLSSPNVIQISLGLSLLPVVMTLEMSSLLSYSIITCLDHHQSYIKRRSAVMAGTFISENPDLQASFSSLIPHLLQLLTDANPAVAIAAIATLSKAFKKIPQTFDNEESRDDIAKASAHILLQATSGALSQHYNIGPINAPFVQVTMLRAIRNLSSCKWLAVPQEVVSAIESVLLQPWGGRNLTLYMTLLEGVTTVTFLPRNEALISQSLKIILGFMKSSFIDFKYLGIKALTCVFSGIEDTLTEAHLEAVLECLDNPCLLLQSRTVRLLCSMANHSNYQAICVTLLEFSHKTSSSNTKDLILKNLAEIIKRIDVDVRWCVAFLSPIIEKPVSQKGFLESLRITLSRGMDRSKSEEEKRSLYEASNSLLELLLKDNEVLLDKLSTAAFILNISFNNSIERVEMASVFTFLEKVRHIENLGYDDNIFNCLLNCGIFIPDCKEKVKDVLNSHMKSSEICACLKSKEKLLMVNESVLTKKVLSKRSRIMSGELKPDLTLSFYDSFVVKALDKDAPFFKPFTVKMSTSAKDVEKRIHSFNPFDAKETHSTIHSGDLESFSPTGSLKSSGFGPSSVVGISPQTPSVWTSRGRLKTKSNSESVSTSSGSGCVEIAHEAEENPISGDSPIERKTSSAASTFLENQKLDLTQALLKGLGIAKN